ncbi:MAG: GNAT family N-acetyltransferase [Bacteroidetes bacterium]|nr:GNAT family N-acetyltransferase [Bacteroidota bacterium]
MSNSSNITLREMQLQDIDLLVAYWLESNPEFLIGMGVDLDKLPTERKLREAFTNQINCPIPHKQSYALIWELDGKPIGHSNVNQIEFGKQATMHLHVWTSTHRKKGMGSQLVMKSLPFYFEKLKIETLICEPYALNPAPNNTLKKVGFRFIKKYTTTPGASNFKQEVNRWELTKEDYLRIQ